MKKFLKRLFLISFVFFIFSHWTTKYIDSSYPFTFITVLYAMPLEFWEGRSNVKTQIYAATEKQVVGLLQSNSKNSNFFSDPGSTISHKEGAPPPYIVLRFKNSRWGSKWGNIKCYCSGFPYPITNFIVIPSRSVHYHDIIFPYPAPIDCRVEKNYTIKTRWKNFWGM